MLQHRHVLFSIGLLFFGCQAENTAADMVNGIDSSVPHYKKVSGIAGNLSSVGSDTLANLMTLWAEEFQRIYPNVNIQVQAAGSSSAPPALIESTANIGPMSRRMKSKEVASFEEKFGYKPTLIPVAIDALAIFVNKDNPLSGLSLAEVDAIFSSTRLCGSHQSIDKWGDVNLTGPWQSRYIQLFGRNSVSGTYGYFKTRALCKGDFKKNVNEQPGSASVVQSVATSINSIGYSGMGYLTAGVRMVPLSKKPGESYIAVTRANVTNGQYPLVRYLYIYVNKQPNKPLEPLTREFLKLILSQQGQKNVIKNGYIPLPGHISRQALEYIL